MELLCSPCSAVSVLPMSVSWRGPLKHLHLARRQERGAAGRLNGSISCFSERKCLTRGLVRCEGRNFSNSIQEGAGKEAKSNRYQFSVHLFASESCTKQQHQRAPAIVVPLNMAGQVRQRSSNAHCRDLAVTLIPASLEGAAATELSRMQSTSLSWGQHMAAERTKWQHFLDRGLA